MRHKPRGRSVASEELNLVPYLDIVVNLVMFLLLASDFAAPLTEIRFGAPPVGVSKGAEDLGVTVAITPSGYVVLGEDPWAASIPGRGADLDVDALTAHLVAAARGAAAEQLPPLTLTADDATDLGRVVATIDAVRAGPDGAELFPTFRFGKLDLPGGG